MPLGNSITQGSNFYPSYRYALWKKLIDAEIDFEFTGLQDLNWNNDTKNEVPSPKAGEVYKGKTEDMRVYPTRTQGESVTLQMTALQPNEEFSIGIYTLEGKLVKSFEAKANGQGNYSGSISPADLKEASLYMVRATLTNRVFLRHLLVDL